MERFDLKVTDKYDGLRLDIALTQSALDLSRRKVRAIIDRGGIYVNGKRVRIASRQVYRGDRVEAHFVRQQLTQRDVRKFELKDCDILFENDGVVALNKPPGLATQATRDQAVQHVEVVLRRYLKQRDGDCGKLILVHRLDKETSGVLLVAKNAAVATVLTDQFRERSVEKSYHAIVRGRVKQKVFCVENHLSAIQAKSGMVRAVRSGGKWASTGFELLEQFEGPEFALMHCSPKTGRSHQIRVHLADAGYPIVGDKRYGSKRPVSLSERIDTLASEHQFLHARRIRIRLQDGGDVTEIAAPYPANFAEALHKA